IDGDHGGAGGRGRCNAGRPHPARVEPLRGAALTAPPAAGVAAALPRWLPPTILQQWAEGIGHGEPLAGLLLRPAAFRAELRRHWPNAVEASAALEAPFDHNPRLPFEAAHLIPRAARFGLALTRPLLGRPSQAIGTRPVA